VIDTIDQFLLPVFWLWYFTFTTVYSETFEAWWNL